MVENRSSGPPAAASRVTKVAVARAIPANAPANEPESLQERAVIPAAKSAVNAPTDSTPVTGKAAASSAPAGSAASASTAQETPRLPRRAVPTARASAQNSHHAPH